MAQSQDQTALQKWGSSPMTWRSWAVVALVIALLVAGAIAVLAAVGAATQDLEDELNDRYVERIEIRTVNKGGGAYRDLIVIDGDARYDCDEDDGRLTCSDEPQPTEE